MLATTPATPGVVVAAAVEATEAAVVAESAATSSAVRAVVATSLTRSGPAMALATGAPRTN